MFLKMFVVVSILVLCDVVFSYYDDEDDFHSHDHSLHGDHDHSVTEHVFRVATFDEVTSRLNATHSILDNQYKLAAFLSNASRLNQNRNSAVEFLRSGYFGFMLPSFSFQSIREGLSDLRCLQSDGDNCVLGQVFGFLSESERSSLKSYRLMYLNQQVMLDSELFQHADVDCVFLLSLSLVHAGHQWLTGTEKQRWVRVHADGHWTLKSRMVRFDV